MQGFSKNWPESMINTHFKFQYYSRKSRILLKINVNEIKRSNIKHRFRAFYLLQRKGAFIREERLIQYSAIRGRVFRRGSFIRWWAFLRINTVFWVFKSWLTMLLDAQSYDITKRKKRAVYFEPPATFSFETSKQSILLWRQKICQSSPKSSIAQCLVR